MARPSSKAVLTVSETATPGVVSVAGSDFHKDDLVAFAITNAGMWITVMADGDGAFSFDHMLGVPAYDGTWTFYAYQHFSGKWRVMASAIYP